MMQTPIEAEDQKRRETEVPGQQFAGMNLDLLSADYPHGGRGLSFQRTRMSADRTLRSVIRTSLALIGFGFTIYNVFRSLQQHTPDGAAGKRRSQLWSGTDCSRRGPALFGHRLPRALHDAVTRGTGGDDQTETGPRSARLSGVSYVDWRGFVVADWAGRDL